MSAKRPADEHLARVDARAYEVVKQAVELLEERRWDYVLGGGWAVYAYGSRVPSADTDVYLPRDLIDEANEAVRSGTGATTGPGGQFEAIALEEFNSILGPDYEMGEPDLGYRPADILRGHVHERTLLLGDARVSTKVPKPGVLAFIKLKAYHDRLLSWRAHRSAEALARVPPRDRAMVLS